MNHPSRRRKVDRMTEIRKTGTVAHALVHGLFERYPDEAARMLAEVEPMAALSALSAHSGASAVAVFSHLNPDIAIGLADAMDGGVFRTVFTALDPVHAAGLLSRMADERVQQRLETLPAATARELRELMEYPAGSAGSLMDPRVTAFRPDETVEMAIDRVRAHRDRRITDICVVDDGGKLVSLIPFQRVAIAEPVERLADLAQGAPPKAAATATREEVVELLETKRLASLPVVSYDGHLLGIIRYDALVGAAQQEATESLQAMVGAGREERALSKASFAIRKRLPWLQVNLGTAFLAAAVVALFEDTIARFTALAVFLPVVAGQAGNTGAQSLAVTMRGLALREIRIGSWPQVVSKETLVAFANGCVVALTTALVVYLWQGSIGIPLVLGLSMVFSMVMAGLSGAAIPVILTSLRQDPAQSASIVLTTVTDIVGFMSFLGLATFLSTAFGLDL